MYCRTTRWTATINRLSCATTNAKLLYTTPVRALRVLLNRTTGVLCTSVRQRYMCCMWNKLNFGAGYSQQNQGSSAHIRSTLWLTAHRVVRSNGWLGGVSVGVLHVGVPLKMPVKSLGTDKINQCENRAEYNAGARYVYCRCTAALAW